MSSTDHPDYAITDGEQDVSVTVHSVNMGTGSERLYTIRKWWAVDEHEIELNLAPSQARHVLSALTIMVAKDTP